METEVLYKKDKRGASFGAQGRVLGRGGEARGKEEDRAARLTTTTPTPTSLGGTGGRGPGYD